MTTQPDDLKKLKHMLGATEDVKKRDRGYRNYYATSGGPAHEAMQRLEFAGLAVKGKTSPSGMMYYHATEAGCVVAGLNAKEIKRAFEG